MNAAELIAGGYGIGVDRRDAAELLHEMEMRYVRISVLFRLVSRDMDRTAKENCRLKALLAFTEHRLAEESCSTV